MQKKLVGVRFIMLFRLPDVSRTQSVGSRNKDPAPVGIESEENPHGFLAFGLMQDNARSMCGGAEKGLSGAK